MSSDANDADGFTDPPTSDLEDGFDSIRDPGLCSNPSTFLTLYRHGASKAVSVVGAMKRFLVQSITVDKNVRLRSQHEYLAVSANDVERPREPLLLFIERTPRESQSVASPSSECLIPQDESPLDSSFSLTPPLSKKTSLSLLEKTTLTVVRGIHSSSASLMELRDAEDRILGSNYAKKASYGNGRVVGEISPGSLTLFDLGLLVEVVHDVAPNYSLFKNHCFWFAKIICDAVVEISNGNCNDLDPDKDKDQPYTHPLPSSSHLPALSGTWNRLLVSEVDDDVFDKVLLEFRKRREREMAKVSMPEFFPSSY